MVANFPPRRAACRSGQAMAKLAKLQFLCNSCGSVHPKWMGKCPDCGTWDALQEFTAPTPDTRNPLAANKSLYTRAAGGVGDLATASEPVAITATPETDAPR